MKLEYVQNQTDENVVPLLALAARVIDAPRKRARVKVYWVRRGAWRWFHGHAYYDGRISIGMPRREAFRRFEYKTLGYFRSCEIPLDKPYSVETWEELLVAIAAHEFAHLMPKGQDGFRKSVRERFCERKCAEALELFRSEDGQRFVREYYDAARARFERRLARAKERAAWKASDDGKLAALRLREKRWRTRAKRAETALRKIKRAIARIERRQALTASESQRNATVTLC